MKHKWLSLLLIAVIVIFLAGTVLCAVMAVMAVRFSEWGRGFIYGLSGIVCVEAMILAVGKLRNKDRT